MSNTIKVIFMGSTPLASPCLQALISDKRFKIGAVATETDKKLGRKKILTIPQLKILAMENNLTVLQSENLNKNIGFLASIKELQPDFIVTVSYGHILQPEILKIPRYGCINVHPSLLPKYRGTSPIKSALANGDHITGVTFIRMNEKLDGGNILYARELPIELSDDALILRAKLAMLAAKALPDVLRDLIDGKIAEIPQDDTKATWCHKIHKNDGLIDLKTLSAMTIFNRVRAFTPWPSCFLIVNGKRLKIIETDIDMEKSAPPGTILNLTRNTIALGTKNGLLIPKKVQLENKRAMTIQEFLAGNRGLLKMPPASAK